MILLVNTASVTPSPVEFGIPNDPAKHLQLFVGWGFIEIVHCDVYDLLEQRFVVFPPVREHHIAEELPHFTLDVTTIHACRHRGHELVDDWQ